MPIVNRFSQSIQQARFNPLSLQEMAYAPSILQQQEEKMQEASDKLAATDVNRLAQDEPLVNQKLGQLRSGIADLSQELANKGYSRDLASKLRGLRTEYAKALGPTGILGRAQQNYTQAQTQWKNIEDDLRKKGASQDIINLNRARFLSGYQGLKNPTTGEYEDFSSGRLPGYYNIDKEAMDLFDKAKQSGELGKVDLNQVNITPVNVPGVGRMLRLVNKKTGQVLSNVPQLEAGINYLMKEYTDPSTERGYFAQSTGLTPQVLGQKLRGIANIYRSQKYATTPSVSESYKFLPKYMQGVGNAGDGTNYLAPAGYFQLANAADIKTSDNPLVVKMRDQAAVEAAKEAGIPNIKSAADLHQLKTVSGKYTGAANIYPGAPLRQSDVKDAEVNRNRKAIDLYNEKINNYATNTPESFRVPMMNINELARLTNADNTTVDHVTKGMNNLINNNSDVLQPVGKSDKDVYNAINKDGVTDVKYKIDRFTASSFNPQSGDVPSIFQLDVTYTDKDGKKHSDTMNASLSNQTLKGNQANDQLMKFWSALDTSGQIQNVSTLSKLNKDIHNFYLTNKNATFADYLKRVPENARQNVKSTLERIYNDSNISDAKINDKMKETYGGF
jgi:hypothetical protein